MKAGIPPRHPLAYLRPTLTRPLSQNPSFLLYLMKTYQCVVCGYIYDEAQGWPQDGIAAGTKWEDVPDTWVCPDCGVGKADFEMVEI